MINYQPQHNQKREIVDIQKKKYNYKSKKWSLSHSIKSKHASAQEYLKNDPWAIQLNQNMLRHKNTCYSWKELNTDNSQISSWGPDLLGVQFKYICSFFLGLSVTIPSREVLDSTGTQLRFFPGVPDFSFVEYISSIFY